MDNSIPIEHRVEVVLVTPDLARRWLERNTRNRPIRPLVVEQYTRLMKNGEWALNGETIKFDTNRDLADGQHRLEAIARSGVTVPMLVVFGLPPASFDTIDNGCKRTNSDRHSIHGELNTKELSAAIKWVWRYQNKKMSVGSVAHLFSFAEERRLLDQNPGLRLSVTATNIKTLRMLGPASLFAALHYLFGQMSDRARDTFFEGLATGAGLSQGDPVLALRNRLTDNRSAKAKLTYLEIAALVIKAYNLHRMGCKVRTLRWTREGANEEAFPEIGS